MKDELNEMYLQLHLRELGDFTSDSYWSSSEISNGGAWYQSFDYGYQYDIYKGCQFRVRLVRDLPSFESNNDLVLSLDEKYFEVAEKDESMKMTWDEAMRKYMGRSEK
jgi:hypothetical protein